MMNRIFTILFFFMAFAFFVAQAIPTEDKPKSGTSDDGGLLGIGIDIDGIVKFLIKTLGISAEYLYDIVDGLIIVLKVVLEALNGLLNSDDN